MLPSIFVNDGKAMFENRGEMDLAETFVSDDGTELDQFVLDRFGIEPPNYIGRLATISRVVK